MAVILGRGILVILSEQTGPGERHQPSQPSPLTLVCGVMNVRRRFLDEKAGELEEQDSNRVASAERIVRIDHLTWEERKMM